MFPQNWFKNLHFEPTAMQKVLKHSGRETHREINLRYRIPSVLKKNPQSSVLDISGCCSARCRNWWAMTSKFWPQVDLHHLSCWVQAFRCSKFPAFSGVSGSSNTYSVAVSWLGYRKCCDKASSFSKVHLIFERLIMAMNEFASLKS